VNPDRRVATVHVLEDNGRGGESLFAVDLTIDAWLRDDLNDGVPAAWMSVVRRCRELIRKCLNGDDS
jgi:hypothetical protein